MKISLFRSDKFDFEYTQYRVFVCMTNRIHDCHAELSLIFEVGGDIQKVARDSSCCGEINMLVLDQSSQGYTSKYKGEIPSPWPLMTALAMS